MNVTDTDALYEKLDRARELLRAVAARLEHYADADPIEAYATTEMLRAARQAMGIAAMVAEVGDALAASGASETDRR